MIKFRVEPDNADAYEVTATTRDIVKWEASNKTNSFKKLMDELRLTDLFALAYHSAVRNGFFTGSLAEFISTVEVHPEAEDDELDPTNPDL